MTKPTLLLVDDEDEIRNSIEELVSNEYTCAHARNGLEAIRILERGGVDIMLTDYNMPGFDGMQLIKSLHEIDRSVPSIVLTGRGSSELNQRALAFNVFEYLEKPFLPNDLRKSLRACWLFRQELSSKEGKNLFSRVLYEDLHLRISKESSLFAQAHARSLGMSVGTLFENYLESLKKKAVNS